MMEVAKIKNVAVISENRNLPYLEEVIQNHQKYLPTTFEWLAYCSDNNRELFEKYSFMIEPCPDIGHRQDYSLQMVSESYWERLCEYDKALVFQHDSGILRYGIEDFYEWDYIGAPHTCNIEGGNGGFSLRTPKVMLNVCKKIEYKKHIGEDVYFSKNTAKCGKLAPREECDKFSVEAIFKLGTFGYHNIDRYFPEEQCVQIRTQYYK